MPANHFSVSGSSAWSPCPGGSHSSSTIAGEPSSEPGSKSRNDQRNVLGPHGPAAESDWLDPPGALLGRRWRAAQVAYSLALDLDVVHPAPERLHLVLLTTTQVRPHGSVRKPHEHRIPGSLVPHDE